MNNIGLFYYSETVLLEWIKYITAAFGFLN